MPNDPTSTARRHPSYGYALFAAQLIASATLVLTADPSSRCLACWSFTGAGAGLAIWAWVAMGIRRLSVLPEVRTNAALVTAPPYRWFRHPMYSGVLAFCGGLVATSYAHWKLGVWLLLLLVLDAKARYEERLLAERFAGYEEYRRRTWRLLPGVY